MPSTATANASKEAPKDAVSATTLNKIMPLTDKDSGSPPSEPVLTLICSSTDSISQDSDLTANISPEVPTMDAANVPLPDEECDEDLLEVGSFHTICLSLWILTSSFRFHLWTTMRETSWKVMLSRSRIVNRQRRTTPSGTKMMPNQKMTTIMMRAWLRRVQPRALPKHPGNTMGRRQMMMTFMAAA